MFKLLSILEPACYAGVNRLGRGFVLEAKPASCTDEVELIFVIEEKAPSLEATHAHDLAILRTGNNCYMCQSAPATPKVSKRFTNPALLY